MAEVVDATVFLLENRGINGVNLAIDGAGCCCDGAGAEHIDLGSLKGTSDHEVPTPRHGDGRRTPADERRPVPGGGR